MIIHIDFYDWDETLYPIPPVPITPSVDECRHTPVPSGYNQMIDWAETCDKTHRQVRCPCCGKWSIWLTKAAAKLYEADLLKRQKEASNRVMAEVADELRLKRARR